MTLLRYARSAYADDRNSGDDSSNKRTGLSRAQRKRRPSRSAVKRSGQQRVVERPAEFHTTIIDAPRPRRASYAVLAAMFLGGACGLGLGFVRSDGSEEALLASTSAPSRDVRSALEVMPALDDEAPAKASPKVTTDGKLAKAEPREDATPMLAEKPSIAVASSKAPAVLAKEPVREVLTDRLRERESLSLALSRHSVGIDDINALVKVLRGNVDLRGMRAGDVFRLESKDLSESAAQAASGSLALTAFEYRPRHTSGAPVRWRAEKDGEGWSVEKTVTPVTTSVVALGGEVKSSLYVAMRALGEGSALVSRFVDVFAWDIDFYRQPQKGDTFKVLVEKQFADGRFVGYGKVLAAEYVNAGDVHRGFAFDSGDGKVAGYFDENGRAREKTFLKNPLEIALITSSYGQRFHPVLRRQRAHHGVDYGAGKGTAFWAVASGVVKEARYSKTAGNMIVIRHINGYETEYFHASRFAEGIRPGAKVKQRQVIGYVGNTGRSTGPHLHFGMRKRGSYVDPGKQVFPAANPVPARYLKEFKDEVGPLLVELEALENA